MSVQQLFQVKMYEVRVLPEDLKVDTQEKKQSKDEPYQNTQINSSYEREDAN